MNPDSFIAVIDPPSFGQYSGTTNVRDGYGTAYFVTTEDAEIGATAHITLELRPRRAASLRAAIDAEVVALPTPAGGREGRIPTPNINPIWVEEGQPFWIEQNWNQSSVAKVIRTEDSVDIYVSADNRRLNGLITRAQRRDTATVDVVKDFYLEHIAFYAMLSELDQDRARSEEAASEPQLLEQEQERELKRACETVCGIAEDLFEVLAGRADDQTMAAEVLGATHSDGEHI
jgi:hypothetical protein